MPEDNGIKTWSSERKSYPRILYISKLLRECSEESSGKEYHLLCTTYWNISSFSEKRARTKKPRMRCKKAAMSREINICC